MRRLQSGQAESRKYAQQLTIVRETQRGARHERSSEWQREEGSFEKSDIAEMWMSVGK